MREFSGLVPHHFDGHNVFSFFSAFLICSKGYKKKSRSAEDAEAPKTQRRAAGAGGSVFFLSLWAKINIEKFRNFWEFFAIYI